MTAIVIGGTIILGSLALLASIIELNLKDKRINSARETIHDLLEDNCDRTLRERFATSLLSYTNLPDDERPKQWEETLDYLYKTELCSRLDIPNAPAESALDDTHSTILQIVDAKTREIASKDMGEYDERDLQCHWPSKLTP